ncbi:MAG TPA: sortase [Flexilinea sp.]|jgi:hypothetical protein|nr:sortase [Flexilinea sp.]HPJ65760.1 sortase [Flexilinea sp.]HPR71236.1 sortase [Flexilinea sp.]
MKNQRIINYLLTFGLFFITGFYFIFGYASVFAQSEPIAAVISKEFEPEYIIPGGVSRLTITISNPNSFDLTLGSPGLTDELPANVIFYSPNPDPIIGCGLGAVSAEEIEGVSIFSISGGTVPAKTGEINGQCSVSINVTSNVIGNYSNLIPAGNLKATKSDDPTVEITNNASADATITVVQPPVLEKSFTPDEIVEGGISRLTITLTNNDTETELTGVTYTDTLPDGLIVDLTEGPILTNCGDEYSITINDEGDTILLSNASIAPEASCSVAVNVTSSTKGTYTNTIYAESITTEQGITNSDDAEAILDVDSASLTLQKVVVNDNGGTMEAADFQASVTAAGSEDPENIMWDKEQLFVPGTYTLNESEVKGYAPRSWDCKDYKNPDNPVSYGLGETGNQITLASGDDAVCTISNDDIPPSLVLNKIVENPFRGIEAEAFWELKADGGEAGVLSGPGAAGGEDVSSVETFQAGTYHLSEKRLRYIDSVPGTWSCVKNDGDAVEGDVVQIEVGDKVVCSITNTLMVRIPSTGFSAKRLTAVREQPSAMKYGTLGIQIEVPILDVTTEVVKVPEEEGSWAVEWLGSRAGLLSGSALPGEGTSYVAAHNHLNNMEVGPFLFIKDLAQNDRIFVRNNEGKLLEFSVYANELFGPDDFNLVRQKAEEFENTLVLITCENEAEDGGYLNRRIVFAKRSEE